MVGECSNLPSTDGYSCEVGLVRAYGAFGSKNVGTSNRNGAENAPRRKIKVSLVMSISQGLVGPKGMVKTVLDGQWVNIPTLPYFVMVGRSVVCIAHYWI